MDILLVYTGDGICDRQLVGISHRDGKFDASRTCVIAASNAGLDEDPMRLRMRIWRSTLDAPNSVSRKCQ